MTKNELKRRYQPVNISMRSNSVKRHDSADIERKTAEFLASGGKIEQAEKTKSVDLNWRSFMNTAMEGVE